MENRIENCQIRNMYKKWSKIMNMETQSEVGRKSAKMCQNECRHLTNFFLFPVLIVKNKKLKKKIFAFDQNRLVINVKLKTFRKWRL